MNCIIVDDEPAARELLQQYIARIDVLHLLAVCSNAYDAAAVLKHAQVSLIFLDINMPRLSGMQFYRLLENPPFVIFTTAYPEFAVEGFEVNAVDYLLKPFPFSRFEAAVGRALDVIRSASARDTQEAFILLRSDKKIFRVTLADIFYLKAVGDYVQVFFGKNAILVHSTFQQMLKQLPGDQFVRVHKSYAVALDKIESYEGARIKVMGKDIPIGSSYRAAFIGRVS